MQEIKKDERLQNNSKAVNSLGYHILLLTLYALLLEIREKRNLED